MYNVSFVLLLTLYRSRVNPLSYSDRGKQVSHRVVRSGGPVEDTESVPDTVLLSTVSDSGPSGDGHDVFNFYRVINTIQIIPFTVSSYKDNTHVKM